MREEEKRRGLPEGAWSGREEAFNRSLCLFLSVLLEKNKYLNLTSIRSFGDAVWKHLYDSLFLLKVNPQGACLDWGTGGGLPGIPIALWRLHILQNREPIILLDSRRKKINALEEFLQALGLDFCSTQCLRGEAFLCQLKKEEVNSVFLRAIVPSHKAILLLDPKIRQWIFFCGPEGYKDWEKAEKKLEKKGFSMDPPLQYSLPKGLGGRSMVSLQAK